MKGLHPYNTVLRRKSRVKRNMNIRKNILLIFVNVTYCIFQVVGDSYNASYISETVVLQSSSVLLRCDVLLENLSRRWTREGEVIYLDKNALSTQLGNTVQLVNNYSLVINPVMLFHEGWYECSRGQIVVKKYKVTVEVQPRVFILIDGNNITDIAVFDQQKTFTAVCHAQRSKPAMNMSWTINNKLLNSSQSSFDCWILENSSTYNCTSTLETRVQEVSGTLTCSATAQNSFGKINSTIPFQTYLIPDVSVSINATPNALFCIGETVTAECLAIRSRPEANFMWVVNDQQEEPSHVECKITDDSYKNAYNCVSTLKIKITEEGIGTVICFAGVHGGFRQNVNVSFRTSCTPEKPSLGTYKWVVVFMVLMPAIFLALRKCFASREKEDKGFPSKNSPRIQRNNFEHRGCRSKVPTNTVPMQIIPAEIKYRSCPTLSENDHDTYAEATNRISVIDVDSIIIADSIPSNGVFGCWFAINTYDDSVMVAKSLKDNAKLSDVNVFQDIAFALSSLPKHRNLASILAISLVNVSSQIFQEYVEGGSLRDYLMRSFQHLEVNGKSSHGWKEITAISRFSLDIVNGMSFLFENKFCHPALSARKVFLNSKGICKLFDFWPMESSKYRLKHIFQKKILPSAWLAPETIFLGQYSHKSDVWSFAIVLWEVYSLGDIPYRGMTNDEIEIEIRNSNLLEKPPDCPGAVFNFMLSSWNLSCKDRPTFRQLHKGLTHVVDDLSKEHNGHRISYLATEQPHYFTLSQSS